MLDEEEDERTVGNSGITSCDDRYMEIISTQSYSYTSLI